jgi:hypothetical protein
MNVELIQVLKGYGNSIVQEIQQNLSSSGTNATGKTSRSLQYTVTHSNTTATLQITGRPFFATVETGRRATPEYTKPSKMFVQAIREWVKAKGIPEAAAYAIAKSIHQKGTKIKQSGGRDDIYSSVINDSLITEISKDLLSRFAEDFANNLVKMYGTNSNAAA